MSSPVIWGPNSISKNLQNKEMLATGQVISSNGPKNYMANPGCELGTTSGWNAMFLGGSAATAPIYKGPAGTALSPTYYSFFCSPAANATVGATYTESGNTYTVVATIVAGSWLLCTGSVTPSGSLLTKATGTGDASIAYSPAASLQGSSKITLTATTSGALSGVYSLAATVASTSLGYGILSDAITIDACDQAKVLSGRFYYKCTSGPTNATWSGTSTNTFAVYIYDVTSATWTQPQGLTNIVQSSGTGVCDFTFQTDITASQYQVYVYVYNNNTGGAIDMLFDDFYLGPQVTSVAPAMSDWVSFTPTGTWSTNTTYTGQWRRVGDSMQVSVDIALAGAPTSASLTVNLPTGYTIDTTKLSGNSSDTTELGIAGATDNTVQAYVGGKVIYFSASAVAVYIPSLANAGTSVTQAFPFTFGANDRLALTYQVPIVGWSSNTVSSADTDTRVVAFRAYRSSNQTSVNPNNSDVKITFETVTQDTHAAFNTSSNRYVAPVSGWYQFSGAAFTATTNVLASYYGMHLYKNGSNYAVLSRDIAASAGTNVVVQGSTTLYLNAGDYVELFFFGAGNNSASQLTITGGTTLTFFTGYRLSGPAVVQATETVAARYSTAAAPSMAGSGAFTRVDFVTKDYDTHNAVTTGASWVFTAPVSGKYSITASILLASATWSANQILAMGIWKNSSQYSQGSHAVTAALTSQYGAMANDVIALNAGDTLNVRVYSGNSGSIGLNPSTFNNYVAITRVGN